LRSETRGDTKIDLLQCLRSQDVVDLITSWLTVVDTRCAQGTSKWWKTSLHPEVWCEELGVPLKLIEDFHHLFRTTPPRLRTLVLRPPSRALFQRGKIALEAPTLIARFVSLHKLVLVDVLGTVDMDLQPLSKLVALQDFTIWGAPLGVFNGRKVVSRNLSALGSLLFLRRLELTDASFSEEELMDALLSMNNLQELKLQNCPGITQVVLQVLSGMQQLQKLCLADNSNFKDLHLEGLSQQPSITWLDLTENILCFHSLEAVAKMSSLAQLMLPVAIYGTASDGLRLCNEVNDNGLHWFRHTRPDVIIVHSAEGLEANLQPKPEGSFSSLYRRRYRHRM
jgi:hypothetical protein